MCIIEKILTKVYTTSDAFLGEKKLELVEPDVINRIDFHTKIGNNLKITVVKKQYIYRRKKKSLFRKQKKINCVYEVYAEFSENMPKLLSDILTEKLVLPQLLNSLISEEKQVNSVVSAFLDIKLKQFNKVMKTPRKS